MADQSRELPGHLLPLAGGTWALWRTLVLRGAGFPARQVLRLAAPASATAADRALRLEETLAARRAAALQAVNAALDELRGAGRWSDKSLRTPLLKALHALASGKPLKGIPAPACTAVCEDLHATCAELAAAQEDFAGAHRREVLGVAQEIGEVAREDRFREAVLWQNSRVVETALDPLASGAPVEAARTFRRRQQEWLGANYLQRYCTKNDTIGFFGPVAFCQLAESGETVSLRCGPGLLQQRTVYFEKWGIDALAAQLDKDPAIRPWLAPRLNSSCYLDGCLLYRSGGKPVPLPPVQAAVLARCDGRRVARHLADELVADPTVPLGSEREVYLLLDDLSRKGVLTWALKVPHSLHPDQELATILERIEPQDLRQRTMAPLAELQGARDRVALAAGAPVALQAALRELQATFTRLTSLAPRHREGQIYAARELIYEDCRRDLEARFGPALTARLGPPLGLMLKGARWAAGALKRRLDVQLRALHSRLCRPGATGSVDGHPFVSAALAAIFLHPERQQTLAEIARELQERWARVLGPLPADATRVRFSASDLACRAAPVFADSGPMWAWSRYFSPDVMIAADGEAALRQGDFELVLGEIHAGNTMLWSCFISQHPDPEQIAKLLEVDLGSSLTVVPQFIQQDAPRRNSVGLSLPAWHRFQLTDDPPSSAETRIVPAAALVIEQTADGLLARTRDGRLAFDPADLFGLFLVQECSSLLAAFLPAAPHQPRVTVDDVVVARERWSFAAAELDFVAIQEAATRFLACRRWARAHGLPRFCFYRVATERKPCYLDLDSAISGDVFARFVRAALETSPAATVTVSEMVPRLDQTWLCDSAGERYTCELRLVALELEGAA